MRTNAVVQAGKILGEKILKNSPTILTMLTVGGIFTTALLASKASILAHEVIKDELKYKKENSPNGAFDPITKKEVIQLTWTYYIPAIVSGVVTSACAIGSNHISLRRNAALVSLYNLTEIAFKEYQAKVVETIGRNKELKVRDDISEDYVRQHPVSASEVIFTGKGEHLCLDKLSGQYFKSDIEKIRQTINTLNYNLRSAMFVTQNELYAELGLRETSQGNKLGWDVDKGEIQIQFSSQLTEDGTPCLVLNYSIEPRFI